MSNLTLINFASGSLNDSNISSLLLDELLSNVTVGVVSRRRPYKNNLAMSATLWALHIHDWLNTYYLPFIIIVGLLGNVNNAIAFIRDWKKLSSPSYYLMALALADVIFLATLFIIWLGQFKIGLFGWNFYQTVFYLSAFSSSMSGKNFDLFHNLQFSIL